MSLRLVARIATVALLGLVTAPTAWGCTWVRLWIGPVGREPEGGYPVNSRLLLNGDARPLWDGAGRLVTPRRSTVTTGHAFDQYLELPVADLGSAGTIAELHLSPPGGDDIAATTLHIGPPDTSPPVPPRVAFGVHRYPRRRAPLVDTCGYGEPPGNVTLWVHVEPAPDPAPGALILYRIVVGASSGALAERIDFVPRPKSIPVRTTWTGDPRDLRVTVTAEDTAGNLAPPVTVSPAAIRQSWGAYGTVVDDEPRWEDSEALPEGGLPTIPMLVPRQIRIAASGALALAFATLLGVVARGIRTTPRPGGWVVAIGDWVIAATAGAHALSGWAPQFVEGAEFVAVGCTVASAVRTAVLIRAVPAAIWGLARPSRRTFSSPEVLIALAAGAWLIGCRQVFPEVPDWVASTLALPFPDQASDNPRWPILTMLGVACIVFAVGVRRQSRRAPLPPDLAQAPLVVGVVVACTEILAVLGGWPGHWVAGWWSGLLWFCALCMTATRPRGRGAAVLAGMIGAIAFGAATVYFDSFGPSFG